MECPKCEGKGFIEYEHGLLQVGCDECEGTGEVVDEFPDSTTKEISEICEKIRNDDNLRITITKPQDSKPTQTTKEEGNNMADVMLSRINHVPSPEPLSKEDLEALAKDTYIPPEAVESIELPKDLEEALNVSLTRTEPDNQPVGSRNTRQSRKPQKQKAGKKTTKRAG